MRGQKQSSLDEGSVNYDADKKIPRKAASHTYDYFRDKWDKFDVVHICLLLLLPSVTSVSDCGLCDVLSSS